MKVLFDFLFLDSVCSFECALICVIAGTRGVTIVVAGRVIGILDVVTAEGEADLRVIVIGVDPVNATAAEGVRVDESPRGVEAETESEETGVAASVTDHRVRDTASHTETMTAKLRDVAAEVPTLDHMTHTRANMMTTDSHLLHCFAACYASDRLYGSAVCADRILSVISLTDM